MLQSHKTPIVFLHFNQSA